MNHAEYAEHSHSVHELVTETSNIKSVLEGITGFSATAVSVAVGVNIDCALRLRRLKRRATVAGSSDKAVLLDRIEQSLRQGPCLDALDLGRPVLLSDVATDVSWPAYSHVLAEQGCRSALGVPMDLGKTSEAVLNFFAPAPDVFTENVIKETASFSAVAGGTLRLAIRIETAEQMNADLKAAMDSRTVIDLACGVVMGQNRCTQDHAFNLLRKASSHRNEKLHTVAIDVISNVSGSAEASAHFDD
ncbi:MULTISPECIES: GAF and ANTAR domain-containing protein [Paenarthrobacter]|uniref:GAF and ANTAR domain-containing protein n=1 Tax=Paenarthrobacter ureafaciens TaxID=37931 RepID=A0AAX3EQ96_PAEUR|nr:MULTISPECIES: GAF and ANTAR domain-containing protein [Paenarthrobacter]NKR12666.1 histidine kinase [Arthrobacter sp. M5]NKR16489.1 histidine kinase [Arthrobacter sp. M6]OEH60085.1 histidine kinase [Arthrobacter sp. D2]OEH63721.1 histidine kinase [Arthrobacter sp. D4]MDO5878288.1 GAF and ANTAR domain-containing protein [Paenarthrobacter sp. SD-1]